MQPAVYKKLADSLKAAGINQPENHLLFLTKYCSIWVRKGNEFEKPAENKDQYIKAFKNLSVTDLGKIISASGATRSAALDALKTSGTKAASFSLSTLTRSAVGMGGMSPLENSITLHHIYGFPILPGSTLKGAARAFAEAKGTVDKNLIKQVFGSEDKNANEDSEKGKVFFWDAIPTHVPRFTADILTPHYGDYYGNDNVAPGDYMTPVPVAFLCMDKGAEFQFILTSAEETLLKQAEEWLKGALTTLGIGAKTNLGYGIFSDGKTSSFTQSSSSSSGSKGDSNSLADVTSAGGMSPESQVLSENNKISPLTAGKQCLAIAKEKNKENKLIVRILHKSFGEKEALLNYFAEVPKGAILEVKIANIEKNGSIILAKQCRIISL